MTKSKLTNLQLEIIKLFNYDLADGQLLEIKDILASYFANSATKEMDKLWNNNGWNNELMEQWANERLRNNHNS
ncbi:hypothetical protein [Mucilaginibacter celer]|uniref:Uncharacterized protein n=1 Tax=Mucilaginibacter celer TaxID=2305508 RepID=A0A494VYM7_9SPHI|nr:hypothetical protein [Mucilaginibacter celer]AYL96102.1 hypothetical protein HYN43_012740 [Mucilaginibacter celer]